MGIEENYRSGKVADNQNSLEVLTQNKSVWSDILLTVKKNNTKTTQKILLFQEQGCYTDVLKQEAFYKHIYHCIEWQHIWNENVTPF